MERLSKPADDSFNYQTFFGSNPISEVKTLTICNAQIGNILEDQIL